MTFFLGIPSIWEIWKIFFIHNYFVLLYCTILWVTSNHQYSITPVTLLLTNDCSVDRFLSDDIDVSYSEEHPLPWHPPICERLADVVEGIDDIPGIKERHTLTTRNRDPHAVPYLMKYGYQGVEAEIGQRISSAMKRVKWQYCYFWVLFIAIKTSDKSRRAKK